jgi:hypothetical protein
MLDLGNKEKGIKRVFVDINYFLLILDFEQQLYYTRLATTEKAKQPFLKRIDDGKIYRSVCACVRACVCMQSLWFKKTYRIQ